MWLDRTVTLHGIGTLLRPPLANAASFVAPPATSWEEACTRWLLDPIVTAGHGGALLAGSLAMAGVCGAIALRLARRRLTNPARAWLWAVAAAALGPAGLLGTHLALRRSHVLRCVCGRPRAVHVAACPACAARWPAPAATGIEVFA